MKNERKILLTKDFYVAIIMILFSGINLWQIFTIKIPASRLMPTFTLIITIASSLSLLIRSFSDKFNENPHVLVFAKKEIVMIVMLIACAFTITKIGFYTSSLLLVLGIGFLMESTLTKKQVLKILLRSTALMIIVYIMFSLLLGMYLPRGVLI